MCVEVFVCVCVCVCVCVSAVGGGTHHIHFVLCELLRVRRRVEKPFPQKADGVRTNEVPCNNRPYPVNAECLGSAVYPGQKVSAVGPREGVCW